MSNGKTEEKLTGIRKAAIMLISLPRDTAAKVMAQLDPDTIEEVSKEIARIRTVDRKERDNCVSEFYNLTLAQKYIDEGGVSYAENLLRSSLPPQEASRLIGILEKSIRPEAFTFLKNARAEQLVVFLKEEHPQTIALILTHINKQQASIVLGLLPPKSQVEVVKRVARLSLTNQEVLEQVEGALKERVGDALAAPLDPIEGVKEAADILKVLPDKSVERTILETLEEEDPDLADKIRKLMFVFDDILMIDDRGVQTLLREIDKEELATALKAASVDLQEKFFKNMAQRAADILKEDMEFMGPQRPADIEAAQQNIIDVVRRLEEQGDIVIDRG
ncbi:MAG: flagellar motor switch protein FliG [Planctomycetes bacterium]|nr:flagellar motor switch protein FliG [Planctomycetota bacterium]